MDALAAPAGLAFRHSPLSSSSVVSLSELRPGSHATVVRVGSPSSESLSALERRLLELGFFHGEKLEILAEARPGRDPFVVRVGDTTLALRRREAETIWVEVSQPGTRV